MISLRNTSFVILLFFGCIQSNAVAQLNNWEGNWITDFGELKITVDDGELSGTLKDRDVDGTAEGKSLKLNYEKRIQQGNRYVWKEAKATLELNDAGTEFKRTDKGKAFRGWKLSDEIDESKTADFSGHWLSNQGNIVLEQKGDKVTGIYGSQGLATLEGTVKGNRLNFKWKKFHFTGKAFIEQSEDGSRIYGSTVKYDNAFEWIGLKAKGFTHHATPKAGEIVKGYVDNGMLYHLRMPDGWKDGDPVDVIVLFHGSNFTTAGMVFITAKNWPEIGKKFAILGIQGDKWADWSDADDLRHNYHYVNWMGKSTYKGFPYTDRESPSLVMEVIEELGDEHSFERTFVGGHSQGGWLTYTISMHFPDKVDGTFPMAGGMMMQCEPDVFEDEALMKAQRTTPMAIIHAKNDKVQNVSMSEGAYQRLVAHGFSNVKFINPSGGHPYDFLPVNEAIEYLDALTTDDSELLLKYTTERLAKKDWRTVGLALKRSKDLDAADSFVEIRSSFDAEASKQVERHLKYIKKGGYGKWVDRFLKWHADFAFADSAKSAVEEWDKLVDTHSKLATALETNAKKAFNEGKSQEGWELRKKIVLDYYASPQYRSFKNGVEQRFGSLYKLAKERKK